MGGTYFVKAIQLVVNRYLIFDTKLEDGLLYNCV